MENFKARLHLPGDDRERDVGLSVDWEDKEVGIKLEQASGGFSDWPGLLVHTFGYEEIVFRTKGIPPLFNHWWHLMRNAAGDLWGLVVTTPNAAGHWHTCSVCLPKVSEK